MRYPAQVPGICIVLLLAAIMSAAGCISSAPGSKGTTTTVPPAVTTGPSSCGFTTCHGLDLACGTNAPQVCTMEYQLGDKCRQYARCEESGGTCGLVVGTQFDRCTSCVEKCQATAGNNTADAFTCEASC